MIASPFLDLVDSTQPWLIGLVCSVIPSLVSLFRKQWSLALATVLACIALAYFTGWAATAWTALALLFFAILSPSGATGAVCLGAIVGLVALIAFGFEHRFPDHYAKLGWPSLVDRFGSLEPNVQVGGSAYRKFTSPDGRTIEARIESVTGNEVTIVRRDGERFTTSIHRFSEPDQQAIRQFEATP